MWLYAFREYKARRKWNWSDYATIAPGKIAIHFPEHVHVENTSFYKPSWYEVYKIYDGFYDWSQNYVLHTWNTATTGFVMPDNPSAILTKYDVKCTFELSCYNHNMRILKHSIRHSET